MPSWLTPPNLLTYLRLLLTPFIGIHIAHRDMEGAFPLLLIASISDALDGWIARKWNWQSELGRKLDPISDKFMLATVYLGLGWAHLVPHWLVYLIFGRDLLILLAAMWALRFTHLRSFPPSLWGKLSTICQMGFAAMVLLESWRPGSLPHPVVPVCTGITAAMTIGSAIHYTFVGIQRLRVPESVD